MDNSTMTAPASGPKREFPIRPYVTLGWQLLLFSLVMAFVLSLFLESWLVWLMPVCVLALSTPYITRIGQIIRDLRRGETRKARLRLKDVSEEYAIAIHHQSGLVSWTLIFEDEVERERLVVLSAAARRSEIGTLFRQDEVYLIEWLPSSRVIRSIGPA